MTDDVKVTIEKVQKIVNLLDSTFKMINSAINLKNSIKKEFKKNDDKENEEQKNVNDSQSQNTLLNKNSFQLYLANKKKGK